MADAYDQDVFGFPRAHFYDDVCNCIFDFLKKALDEVANALKVNKAHNNFFFPPITQVPTQDKYSDPSAQKVITESIDSAWNKIGETLQTRLDKFETYCDSQIFPGSVVLLESAAARSKADAHKAQLQSLDRQIEETMEELARVTTKRTALSAEVSKRRAEKEHVDKMLQSARRMTQALAKCKLDDGKTAPREALQQLWTEAAQVHQIFVQQLEPRIRQHQRQDD